MTNYERNSIAISVALALAGIMAALFWGAGHYFARSGALITIVAIVFASLDLRSRLAAAPAFIEEQLQTRRDVIFQQGKDHGLSDVHSDALVAKVAEGLRKESREAIESASQRVLRVELALFIAGTVVWGFGDLPIDALLTARGCK